MRGKIYLIPNLLGEGRPDIMLSINVLNIVRELRFFIVEDIRAARRFLSKVGLQHDIDSITFYILNEHTSLSEISTYLDPIKNNDIGLLSEAGMPCIADPGVEIVRMAYQKDIRVVPLVGPSSILMAIMASGLNGQNFAFNGYLPIKHSQRINKIRFFERRVFTENQTQVFIETPYRNLQLIDDFLSICSPSILLGIAVDISFATEYIKTKSIENWKKNVPAIHKRPAIFMIGR